MRLARFSGKAATSGFEKHLSGSDVPLADLLFNVGVEATTGDVSQGQGRAAEHPGFADFDGDALEAVKAGFEGFAALGESDSDDGV